MADTNTYYVAGLVLEVEPGVYVGYTDSLRAFTYAGYGFTPAPTIDFSRLSALGADLDCKTSTISGIPIDSDVSLNIFYRFSYDKVKVKVFEIKMDLDAGTVIEGHCILLGRLSIATSDINNQLLSIEVEEEKKYFDKIAGVRCTEMCAAAYFGDKICKVVPYTTTGIVSAITRTSLILTAAPSTTLYLFNNGYVDYDNLYIKIIYWKSGNILSLAEVPPSSWLGATINITEGCDRTLDTCRTKVTPAGTTSNEERFFGLGYSMVDHNAIYETF